MQGFSFPRSQKQKIIQLLTQEVFSISIPAPERETTKPYRV